MEKIGARSMSKLTRAFVEEAFKTQKVWDLGNDTLYRLCADHPGHTADDVIIAKTWLIGRAYAAAIERRRIASPYLGDAFYEEHVAPRIREAKIDLWLQELSAGKNSHVAVKIHKKLTDLLHDLTGLNKRSFASKYLHFHFPAQFFVFDVRARDSVNKLVGRQTPGIGADKDQEYADFYARCEYLSHSIAGLIGRVPDPRELDKVLLWWSRKRM
jgi:hypothetical protein